MKCTVFDYGPTNRWYQTYSYNLHLDRLRQIQQRTNARVDNAEPVSRKLLPRLSHDTEYLKQTRLATIEQKNAQIFTKLTEAASPRAQGNTMKSDRSVPDSLNVNARRQEAIRIEQENLEILKRLSATKPTFVTKEVLKDFEVTRKYKQNSSKKRVWPEHSKKSLSTVRSTRSNLKAPIKTN